MKIISGCIRLHNVQLTEKLQWSSPVQCLEAALTHPKSGLFIQPLPVSTQENMRLMQHIEVVTVRGNVNKNERPYFNLDRWRYTNPILANSFWLIGKKLLTYTDRRKCRIVYATVIETGEQLGLMTPGGWRSRSDCSWRDRKLFNKAGLEKRYSIDFDDPLEDWKEEKIKTLRARSKSGRKKSSKDALDLARITKFTSPIEKTANTAELIPQNKREQPSNRADPFELSDIPKMTPITRRAR